MRFNLNALAMVLLLGCGEAKAPHHWREARGEELPATQSALNLWTGDGANLLITLQRHSGTFTLFTTDPFGPVQTQFAPLPETAELIQPSQDGQYYLAASTSGYAVVLADGTVNLNPEPLTGSPQALAFHPSTHVAVLTDDQQEMALLHFDAAGGVLGSLKSTSKFPNGQWALGGAMLPDGSYAATLSGSAVAIVDIPGSIAAKAFKARTFNVAGATDMWWIAAVSGLGFNAVLIQDGTRLLLINTDSGAILDQKELGSATALGWFSDLSPHVITQSQDQMAAQKNDVTFVTSAAKLKTTTFQGSSELIASTWLDNKAGTLAISYDRSAAVNAGIDPYDVYDETESVIARFHTSDGSALDNSLVAGRARVALRSDFFFTTYASALGMSERVTYGSTPETQSASLYTFAAIRNRFRQ